MILMNETTHAIYFDGVLLVPMVPKTVDAKASDLKAQYPHLAAMFDAGDIVTMTKKDAAQAQADIDSKIATDAQETPAKDGE